MLLIVAGLQVPVTPFGDGDISNGAVAPEQNGAIAAKCGTVFGVTVTLNVCCVAHCPASGVNT